MNKKASIRTTLIRVFIAIVVFVFVTNVFIFSMQKRAVKVIENVYNSNISLNDMSETLDLIQDSLYEYLNTKSPTQLETYYTCEQNYRRMIQDLNRTTVNNENKLMEKNIFNMSETYLEETHEVIEAKRGRNISRYNKGYDETENQYNYLKACISSLNTTTFLENSNHFSFYRTSLGYMVVISLATLAIIMIIAVLWLVIMTRSITRPLIELADAANEIARGNMNVDFPIVETNDEVGTVAKACNKMIESIRIYIQKTRENFERESKMLENELIMKNDLKEAQLKYLQAQINPHFLFNSLNAGAQLAMMEGAEKACLFIENMADFFRYNVRKIDGDTTLGEELQLIDSYIYILNVRFSGDIHYYKQIDERLLSVSMPGMILQPIVENAVNHGIREMEGQGEIHLSVYADGSTVCVKVTDNGNGISQEVIDKVMNGKSAHGNNERDSAGIGMENVIGRLRRYYNTDRVIQISNRTEGGTEIILYLSKCERSGK